MLRTPSVTDSTGGAISEKQARERGRMVKTADQVAELAAVNGLKVSPSIEASLLPTPVAADIYSANLESSQHVEGTMHSVSLAQFVVRDDLLPTPAVAHIRNHDEPIEDYLQRRQDFFDGRTKGLPGASLGVAVRMAEQGLDWKDDELLPTPTTMEHREIKSEEKIAELKAKSPGGYRNLREEVIHKLPTPLSRDYKDGSADSVRDGKVSVDTVSRAIFGSGEVLLPTTRTSMANGSNANEVAAGDPKKRIENTVLTDEMSWGKFEPAIRRWELILGRPAPAPTKPDGKDGSHRLSSMFTEWMMGLPEGWITGHGLSRAEELKMAGNGVVPQQAEYALRILLADFLEEK